MQVRFLFLAAGCRGTCPGRFALQSATTARYGQFLTIIGQNNEGINQTNSKTNQSSKKECVRDGRAIPESCYQWCTKFGETCITRNHRNAGKFESASNLINQVLVKPRETDKNSMQKKRGDLRVHLDVLQEDAVKHRQTT